MGPAANSQISFFIVILPSLIRRLTSALHAFTGKQGIGRECWALAQPASHSAPWNLGDVTFSETPPAAPLWGGVENCFNWEAINERGRAGCWLLLLSESPGHRRGLHTDSSLTLLALWYVEVKGTLTTQRIQLLLTSAHRIRSWHTLEGQKWKFPSGQPKPSPREHLEGPLLACLPPPPPIPIPLEQGWCGSPLGIWECERKEEETLGQKKP